MASRRRRPGRATTAAAVGLCLAAVTTTHTSVAFHLHTAPRGTVAVGSGGCDHAPAAARRSATCRLAMLGRERGGDTPSAEVDNHDNRCSDRREGRAAKELSALLLSAMLLGNPKLADAAATTQASPGGGAAPAVDPTVQSRLIADLERRLMSMPTSDSDAAGGVAVAPAVAAAPAARIDTTPQGAAAAVAAAGAADVDDPPRIQPMFVPPVATSQAEPAAAAEAPAPPPAPEAPPAPKRASPSTATGSNSGSSSSGSNSKEPLIKMKEYSISIKLPELNLPPVAPITVPEEGSPFADATLFKAPSRERVAAQPNLPGAGLVREALQGVARGEGVRDLVDALAAATPKQADYNRAVIELEERVRSNIRTVDNPTFAPGVPLAPEFVSMLDHAKNTAFDGVRPYLPKGVEPELALFMLTTLPVLTVALRAADENSRRPMPAPLPPGYRPPRVVRFPNSPAKVDAEAVAEARKAREAQNDINAVKALREELSSRGLAAVPADASAAASLSAAATVVDLEGGVAAAVAAKPESMTAELARLREELAAAGKLAAKVEALERANARLMSEVAELRREPSLEEIKLRAEREAARAAAQREREERRAAAYSNMKVKAEKLSAARQVMVDIFPSRETDLAAVQETEVEVEEEAPAAVVELEAEEEEEEVEEQDEEDSPASPAVKLLKPEDVDPLSAARERLADAFPGSETAQPMEEVPAAAADTPKAAKKKAPAAATATAAAKKKPAAATASKKKATAAKKKGETVTMKGKVVEPKKIKPAEATATAGKKKSAASSATAPKMQNGGTLKEPQVPVVAAGPTADEYDDLSEDLSRALRGVQGYDLDALDLEMDDLRPEDLEELRNLEREMGDLDLASLEAEFDQEDDESISQALRMAAESALAHTSGGGAGGRIRTASTVGATSSRSVGDGGSDSGATRSRGAAAVAVAESGSGGGGGGGGGGVSAPTTTRATAQDELDAFRRLEAEAGVDFGDGAWGGVAAPAAAAVAGRGGSGEPDDGDWSGLTAKAIARKKVSVLKEYLDEEGVDYPDKAKKAQLVDLVVGVLAG